MAPLALGMKQAHFLNEKKNKRGNRKEVMKSEYTLEVKYYKA